MTLLSWILKGLVLGYRYLISPVLPGACRYQPTCSVYALEAIDRFGPLKGGILAVKRLARCHPWGGSGYDPIPEAACACSHEHPRANRDKGRDCPA